MSRENYKQDNTQRLKYIESKTNFNEYTIQEARGFVIEYTLKLEHIINMNIVYLYDPKNERHFYTNLLNSSIIDSGAKVKFLLGSDIINAKTAGKIRELMAIRNGFAHATINDSISVKIQCGDNQIVTETFRTKIEVMNASGKLKEKLAIEYLEDFREIYNSKIIQDFFKSVIRNKRPK